jgi:thiosulfate/3-mercaptopyruvate sulfurtransferase
VDIRSPKEFPGELLTPEKLPRERVQPGGHILGAVNIPGDEAVRPEGTSTSAEELESLYQRRDITPDKEIIAYCGIGERAAHTWAVLKELLRDPTVRTYDGAWTEWGWMVGAPVERAVELQRIV